MLDHMERIQVVRHLGTSGANSMFTDVTSPAMYVYRSFPMMDQMTINGELKFDEMSGSTDKVTITNSNIAGKLIMQGCGVDIKMDYIVSSRC